MSITTKEQETKTEEKKETTSRYPNIMISLTEDGTEIFTPKDGPSKLSTEEYAKRAGVSVEEAESLQNTYLHATGSIMVDCMSFRYGDFYFKPGDFGDIIEELMNHLLATSPDYVSLYVYKGKAEKNKDELFYWSPSYSGDFLPGELVCRGEEGRYFAEIEHKLNGLHIEK